MIRRATDLPEFDPDALPRDAVIAIDGPAGSGKSTTARALAQRFGLVYVDSGAMYRALTLAALGAHVPLEDDEALVRLLTGASLELKSGRQEAVVSWNGKDVSKAIRSAEVDGSVSKVAAHDAVRREMVRRQQELGRRGGVVMEGRDIGSVVFPLATAKIFLRASLDARVERRFRQARQRGDDPSREELAKDLAARDRIDSERTASPLLISPDAIVVDSSDLGLEEQIEACARACLVNPALDRELDTDLEASRREMPWHYRLAYGVFNALARFYGMRTVGNEGGALPRGVVTAVNHVSYWDPPLMGSVLMRYPVHTLAKAELFKPDFPMGTIFRKLDSIPIRRRGYDRAAFAEAADALQKGNCLLIFPEGTRRAIGHLGPVKNGLGILIQATEAPLMPLFLRGSYGKQPGGSLQSPLELRWGPVIRWHGLDALREDLDPKEISRRIAALCLAVWNELQARSFADIPQTAFERELGEKQLRTFSKRQKRLFGDGG